MQEAQLYAVWQNLGRSGQVLKTGTYRLRVLDAGQLNLHRGPDFVSAVFELNGTRFSGDVEMHQHANDWYLHHHHLDPFFKNVCLHVVPGPSVSNPENVTSALTQRTIPTLALDLSLLPAGFQSTTVGCQPPSAINAAALQQLALERLHLKIRSFQHLLESQPIEQVFYEYFFRVLGYPHNAWPFQLLARHLPWNWLRQNLPSSTITPERLYAIYAGTAGFLPQVASDPFLQQLIRYYRQLRQVLPAAALTRQHWQFAGLRPVNHPHFRLAAWVAIFFRYQLAPFKHLYQLFELRLPAEALYKQLQHFFALAPDGYWARHHSLASRPTTRPIRHFFGVARISELILNLLIPLFSARALAGQSDGFFAYLTDFFLFLPLQSIYQKLKKRFPWLAQYQASFPNQALMQALIHLDEQFCSKNNCNLCPLEHIIDK